LARSGLSAIAVLSPALDIVKHARAAMVSPPPHIRTWRAVY
jgi:hypothetical protein